MCISCAFKVINLQQTVSCLCMTSQINLTLKWIIFFRKKHLTSYMILHLNYIFYILKLELKCFDAKEFKWHCWNQKLDLTVQVIVRFNFLINKCIWMASIMNAHIWNKIRLHTELTQKYNYLVPYLEIIHRSVL